MSTWIDQLKDTGGGTNNTFLLLEDGNFLLLEDTGKIILELGAPGTTWTDQIKN